MRQTQLQQKESQVLEKLSHRQVEQAFQVIAGQQTSSDELNQLSSLEWLLLQQLLENLLLEKEHQPLQ